MLPDISRTGFCDIIRLLTKLISSQALLVWKMPISIRMLKGGALVQHLPQHKESKFLL